MKKVLMLAVAVVAAAVVNAATVAWTGAGMGNYSGDQYYFFVIGQNGVTDTAQITALLDAGTDVGSYAFGSGLVAANGSANNLNSGKMLDAGTYTSFMVLLDGASAADADKYVLISGGATQTQSFSETSAKVTFIAGNIGSIVNDPSNWKSFGSSSGGDIPEPTSGLLLLVGGAALALRRKQK